MKISELIVELQKFKEKEDDLPVYVHGHGWGDGGEDNIDLCVIKEALLCDCDNDGVEEVIYPKRLLIE